MGDTRQLSAILGRARAWLIAKFTRMLATGPHELSVVSAASAWGQLAHQRYVQETRLAGLLPPTRLYPPILGAALAGTRAALTLLAG